MEVCRRLRKAPGGADGDASASHFFAECGKIACALVTNCRRPDTPFIAARLRASWRARANGANSTTEEKNTQTQAGPVPHRLQNCGDRAAGNSVQCGRRSFAAATRRSGARRAYGDAWGLREAFGLRDEKHYQRVGRAGGAGAWLRRLQQESHGAGAGLVY